MDRRKFCVNDLHRKLLIFINHKQVQFLPKAVQTLVSCRKHLMNTYIFANYAVDSHQKTIFEDNQSNLEISVENLAQHLEMEVDEKNVKDVVEKIMCLAK